MFIRPCLAIVTLVSLAASLFSQNADAVPPALGDVVQRMLGEERGQLVPDGCYVARPVAAIRRSRCTRVGVDPLLLAAGE